MLLVILLGNSGVGKSNIVKRYISNSYCQLNTTVGIEFATKVLTINKHKIKTQIWDTSGCERYMALTKAHLRRAVGALLVYDISNLQSFNSIKDWLKLLRGNAEEEIVIALVGNKCDIMFSAPEKRMVTKKMGEQLANDENIIFLGESSALAGINIKDILEHLVNSTHLTRNILFADRDALPRKETGNYIEAFV